MAEKFFRDPDGNFLGVFSGVKPPLGAIECASPPSDGRQKWDGSGWGAVPVNRVLTPRQFRQRLTEAEQAAIMTAALSNVNVLAWRLAAAEAQEIDLDHPDTAAGLAYLQSLGLLTEARAAEIMA